MNWYLWRFWRFAYAPHQSGEQRAHGYRWLPLPCGLYVARAIPAFVPKRRGSGEWITGAVPAMKIIGLWVLRAWIVIGWLIFIPLFVYLSHA